MFVIGAVIRYGHVLRGYVRYINSNSLFSEQQTDMSGIAGVAGLASSHRCSPQERACSSELRRHPKSRMMGLDSWVLLQDDAGCLSLLVTFPMDFFHFQSELLGLKYLFFLACEMVIHLPGLRCTPNLWGPLLQKIGLFWRHQCLTWRYIGKLWGFEGNQFDSNESYYSPLSGQSWSATPKVTRPEMDG